MNRYLAAHAGLITALLLACLVALAALALLALFGGRSGARADTSGWAASQDTGYAWIDSNAPDPVVPFEWVDATGGTQAADITDEADAFQTLDLPFTFNFFATNYTQVDVSTNGFLSFNIGSECNDNYNWDDTLAPDSGNPIPHTDALCDDTSGWGANPLIAAWFDNLDPSECGDIYYDTVGSAPDQQFVVEYSDVCHNDCDLCEPGEGITFEIILFEGSNDIKVQYLDTVFNPDGPTDIMEENNGGTATTGIDANDSAGLPYHHATPDLTDELAVLYTEHAADIWVTKWAAPDSVQVGDELTYTIHADNAGPAKATGLTITDDLPDGITYVSATWSASGWTNPPAGTCDQAAGTVTCDIGDLGVTDAATVDIVVTVDAEGTIENTASAAFDQININADGSVAVLAITVGAAPTPTPAQLPTTGGQPGSSSGLAWLALAIGGIAALAGGAVLTRRFARPA